MDDIQFLNGHLSINIYVRVNAVFEKNVRKSTPKNLRRCVGVCGEIYNIYLIINATPKITMGRLSFFDIFYALFQSTDY